MSFIANRRSGKVLVKCLVLVSPDAVGALQNATHQIILFFRQACTCGPHLDIVVYSDKTEVEVEN